MMLPVKNWLSLSVTEKKHYLSRPAISVMASDKVQTIIQQVREYGDKALYQLTEQLDRVSLKTLQIPKEHIQTAQIGSEALIALNQAIQTITTYHEALLPENKKITTSAGVDILHTYRPIQRVGLYVPGGNKTPLVSSLLMQAIPAQVAGCPLKILCTPPDAQGKINAHLLVAARLCGIETVYAVGGAQAIAAMAYGTESISKVDKIFGPGNSYVTEAKNQVARDPAGAAIDMPAGPSEVMIVADDDANPAFLAADLLAQAEHGPDSQVLLICNSVTGAEKVNRQLSIQLAQLSRKDLIQQSLAHSTIIICPDANEQINIINAYAPEHLIINKNHASSWVDQIVAAGTVFLGPWAAETMGDYVTGSNHVLPTHGFARNHNGLSTTDFLTRFSVQSISKEGILKLGAAAMTLARIEGLDGHANAVQIRLNALEV